jgi:hypothetical protein
MRHLERMALLLRHHGQHWLNPLHVFCRLKDRGMDAHRAAAWAAAYEMFIYRKLQKIGIV